MARACTVAALILGCLALLAAMDDQNPVLALPLALTAFLLMVFVAPTHDLDEED
jgi:hypothetical protein